MRPVFVMLFIVATFAMSALSATAAPIIGSVTPISATANVAVELSATVSSSVAIERCTLWADLAEIGNMTVANGKATRSHTFTSGGSHIAFVFCRDTQGGMSSGDTTAITVSGQIIQQAPLQIPTSSGGGSVSTPTPSTSTTTQQTSATSTQQTVAEPSAYVGQLLKAFCPVGADMNHFCRSVYYVGKDNKRHAFPNSRVFFTWYEDFGSVEEVTIATLSNIPLGSNVQYRAGARMVKFTTDPKVYAVSKNGLLRWIQTEDLASAFYGTTWNKQIDDMPDSFYADYTFGESIDAVSDYNPEAELQNSKE